MENYQPTQSHDDMERRPHAEGELTARIESYTGALPSMTYLEMAGGAMALSLACEIMGRGKWGQFIGQWVPTLLLLGVYNKLVKLQGHDRFNRGAERLGSYRCDYCESTFSLQSDLANHQKHCTLRTTV